MRHRMCLALILGTVLLLPLSARAQDVNSIIEGSLALTSTSTQNWMAAETHFWVVNTDRDPAATATWFLNVPQSGRGYELQVFIPAPSLLESQPRTNSATYGIRPPGGGLTFFTLNQAVTSSQWVPVSAGVTFDRPGTYQLVLSGKTGEPAGTRVVVASAARLVATSGSGTPGGTPGATPEGPPFPARLDFGLADRAFALINQMRVQRGIPPLRRSGALDAAEAGHVLELATNDRFSLDTPEGLGATQRARRQGYNAVDLVNIVSVGDSTAEAFVRGLSNDVLNPAYTDAGLAVAVAPGSTFGFYWSLVVARR